MTMIEDDPKKTAPEADPADPGGAPGEAKSASPWWEDPDAPPPEDSKAEIERLESEKADLTERLIRLAADMDNLRKRTEREMERLLERNGISRIAATGERFDPHRHQAMYEVPDPTKPAGTVVEVIQEGYQIGDRVLRAALVGISKGGPKAAPAEAPSEATADQS
jgi:molecular chaperone GrpE (heat shock protein)